MPLQAPTLNLTQAIVLRAVPVGEELDASYNIALLLINRSYRISPLRNLNVYGGFGMTDVLAAALVFLSSAGTSNGYMRAELRPALSIS